MASGSHPEISAALNCLAHILTPELARDLALDIIPMLNHSRPLIRKRAILVLYKMMLLDSDALDRGFNKLREKLEDPDVGEYPTPRVSIHLISLSRCRFCGRKCSL